MAGRPATVCPLGPRTHIFDFLKIRTSWQTQGYRVNTSGPRGRQQVDALGWRPTPSAVDAHAASGSAGARRLLETPGHR